MVVLTRRTVLAGVAGATMPLPRPAEAAPRLAIRDLYVSGTELSAEAEALAGQQVVMRGFMAPPLKAAAPFFVLTRQPLAVCPFCSSAADWPGDIVLVRLRRRQDWVGFDRLIEVTGRLDLGVEIDLETGFVSLVRIIDASFRPL